MVGGLGFWQEGERRCGPRPGPGPGPELTAKCASYISYISVEFRCRCLETVGCLSVFIDSGMSVGVQRQWNVCRCSETAGCLSVFRDSGMSVGVQRQGNVCRC